MTAPRHLLPLVPLAALTACGVPFSYSLNDFSLPVSQNTLGGQVCYAEVTQNPQSSLGSLSIDGIARYPGSGSVTAKLDFYARTSAPQGSTVSAGSTSLTCLQPGGADQRIGSVTVPRGGPDQPYRLEGSSLTEGVRAGHYWLGAVITNSGVFADVGLVDYGSVLFTQNKATFTVR